MIRDTHLLSANEFPEEKGERNRGIYCFVPLFLGSAHPDSFLKGEFICQDHQNLITKF